MNKRALGKSGLEVSPLAFGCNVFGRTADEPTAFNLPDALPDALLDALVAAGEVGFDDR